MNYEELHQRYGTRIAKKVQEELSPAELNQVAIQDLLSYLEIRAEAAFKEYQAHIRNPLGDKESSANRAGIIDLLHRRWKSAEEISWVVAIGEEHGVRSHLRVVNG